MASQTLEQVIASLGSVYQPQVDAVQAQQALLPQQLQNDEQALQGQQTQAFDSILQGARRRGTGVAFGGIPLGEQAQYNATTYMPAAANLRSTYATKGLGLQDAINKINENRFNQANGIYQFGVQQDFQEQQLAEQRRQFDLQQQAAARAAAASSYSPSLGYAPSAGGAAPKAATQGPQYIGNNDLRGHLNYLAQKQGNQDAAIALKYVGNDGKYNLNPNITNPTILNALARIGAVNVWKSTSSSKPNNPATVNPGLGGSTSGLNKVLGK